MEIAVDRPPVGADPNHRRATMLESQLGAPIGVAHRSLPAGSADRGRPMAGVWLTTTLVSYGSVLTASLTVPGLVFSFWRLWFGALIVGPFGFVAHRRAGSPTLARAGLVWSSVAGFGFAAYM